MQPTYYFLLPGGRQLPIIIRKHQRSRRMVVRYQPLDSALSLTLPRYVSIKQGLHFIEEKRGWIERQIDAQPQVIPLKDGQHIPVFGQEVVITHREGRGVTRIEAEQLLVHGDVTFTARRVREFLHREAKQEIVRLATEKAELIGKRIKKISLRDTTSRWGSCSHDNNLSFSWRLVFAPPFILDYIVCHEVAHMREHNHSNRFWALTAQLCPRWKEAERWIEQHGAELYRYQ